MNTPGLHCQTVTVKTSSLTDQTAVTFSTHPVRDNHYSFPRYIMQTILKNPFLVNTHPDGPAITAAVAHTLSNFSEDELIEEIVCCEPRVWGPKWNLPFYQSICIFVFFFKKKAPILMLNAEIYLFEDSASPYLLSKSFYWSVCKTERNCLKFEKSNIAFFTWDFSTIVFSFFFFFWDWESLLQGIRHFQETLLKATWLIRHSSGIFTNWSYLTFKKMEQKA